MPDGGRDLSTEHALQRLEDAYARIRDGTLARREPLSAQARSDLMLFLGALRERSPAMREHHAMNDAAVLRVADDIQASVERMTPEQRSRLPRPLPSEDRSGQIPLEEFRAIAARPFGQAMPQRADVVANVLERMHLTILVAAAGSESLVTSDRPMTWWDPTDPPPSRRPLGLARPDVEVTVPVSPTLCALISHTPGPGYADIGPDAVDVLNMRTLCSCREVFVSEKPSLGVDWLAAAEPDA